MCVSGGAWSLLNSFSAECKIPSKINGLLALLLLQGPSAGLLRSTWNNMRDDYCADTTWLCLCVIDGVKHRKRLNYRRRVKETQAEARCSIFIVC